jgi:hypothetical protein
MTATKNVTKTPPLATLLLQTPMLPALPQHAPKILPSPSSIASRMRARALEKKPKRFKQNEKV